MTGHGYRLGKGPKCNRSVTSLRMRRRDFLLASAALLAPACVAAQSAKVYRIGFLGPNNPATAKPFLDVFFQRMRELGYAEGKNLIFEPRFAYGDVSKLGQLAGELVAWRPDVLIAASNPAVIAAKSATSSIPIVMLYGGTPVEAGLVESLARPGGNVTGLAYAGPETSGKAFEILKEAFPSTKRILCLYESPFPGMELYIEQSQRAAEAMGLALVLAPIKSSADIDPALARIRRERLDGVFVGVTPRLYNEIKRIIQYAARERVPAIYTYSSVVDEGGLMSYAAVADHWRDGVVYVDKILKGAKPGDLPVEQPTRYELVINLRTARSIGLTIPRSVLLRADRVIE